MASEAGLYVSNVLSTAGQQMHYDAAQADINMSYSLG